MGRPGARPLLPRINRFLVGDGGGRGGWRNSNSSVQRGVQDLGRARPEPVRGDSRPFPWQGHRLSLPPPPDSLQPGVPSTSSAPSTSQAAGRSEDVPSRFLVIHMMRSMVQCGVAAGVVTVVDWHNGVFRLHSKDTTPRRARPERVSGDPRPFPWQGRQSGQGRRGSSLPPPPPPYPMQAGVPSTSSAPSTSQAAGRSEDVPPRFQDLVTDMVRSMVDWGVVEGVITVVDGPNAIYRLHSKATTPGSRTPPRPRPRPRPPRPRVWTRGVARLASRSGASTRRRLGSSRTRGVARLASRSGASTRRRLGSSRRSHQRQYHRRR